jgi:GTPase SAR1 family protein
MTSTLLSLFQRFYPSDTGQRVVIAGLDYSGKTTLLYLLKTGEVVTTIPSIGFNVEVVEAPTSSNGSKKPLKLEGWDVGTGCAGPSMIVRMLRYYMPLAKAIIWVVDSADEDRLTQSVETLDGVLADADRETGTGDRHVPVLM